MALLEVYRERARQAAGLPSIQIKGDRSATNLKVEHLIISALDMHALKHLPPCWEPLADVYRTPYGWLLKFDLAGVRLNDVTVSVRARHVSISGFRKDTVVEEGSRYYSMEISYNRFERTLEMPVSLENAQIALEARDGILLVRMAMEGNPHVR